MFVLTQKTSTFTHTKVRFIHKDDRNQSVKGLPLLHYKLVVGSRFLFNIQLMSCGFSSSCSQRHRYTFYRSSYLPATRIIVLFTQIMHCYIGLIVILTVVEKRITSRYMPLSVFILRDYINTYISNDIYALSINKLNILQNPQVCITPPVVAPQVFILFNPTL